MDIRQDVLILILLAGLVTWIPRVLPFIVLHRLKVPQVVAEFLSFVPVCLLGALSIQSLFVHEAGQFSLSSEHILAAVPTILTAIFSRSLVSTVIVGVLSMALVRYFS
ncbi:AzlD domain-containing protein [Exiguobacterium flavidum]|uniref:AzlD domain-containing protein n=1 Tax=Exiguobacterium flavidum TaxID=2184695 RepID=UPI000DF7DCC5|nr:AzlD domain-containing protein [Exiguobacterium flavidum]